MKEKLLTLLIQQFLSLLDANMLKKFADCVLDFIEDYAVKSENKWDDKILIPLCGKVRETFGIGDND